MVAKLTNMGMLRENVEVEKSPNKMQVKWFVIIVAKKADCLELHQT